MDIKLKVLSKVALFSCEKCTGGIRSATVVPILAKYELKSSATLTLSFVSPIVESHFLTEMTDFKIVHVFLGSVFTFENVSVKYLHFACRISNVTLLQDFCIMTSYHHS